MRGETVPGVGFGARLKSVLERELIRQPVKRICVACQRAEQVKDKRCKNCVDGTKKQA